MQNSVVLGLLGRNISYSFSKKYFTEKFRKLFLRNYTYEIFDIAEISQVKDVLNTKNLRGFNVTIPYKEQILPYLDELSDEAAKIGAVNTVLVKDGRMTGYNTDTFGFEKTLLLHRKSNHKKALILGDGGAAKAVRYILEKHDISYQTVSRRGNLSFENLTSEDVRESSIIVQCTPVGTFPNVSEIVPFPFEALGSDHLLIDLIYNPDCTEFLRRGSEMGAKTVNGFYMLEQQAEKAWEIWNS